MNCKQIRTDNFVGGLLVLTFYCVSNWKTCQKAKAWLSEKGVDFTYRDLVKEPLSPEEVVQLGEFVSEGVHYLLNKKSASFKKCHIDANNLSEVEMTEFLADKPRALKRPLLTDGNQLVVGFQKEDMEALIGKNNG